VTRPAGMPLADKNLKRRLSDSLVAITMTHRRSSILACARPPKPNPNAAVAQSVSPYNQLHHGAPSVVD
jgi:hypothetical protein